MAERPIFIHPHRDEPIGWSVSAGVVVPQTNALGPMSIYFSVVGQDGVVISDLDPVNNGNDGFTLQILVYPVGANLVQNLGHVTNIVYSTATNCYTALVNAPPPIYSGNQPSWWPGDYIFVIDVEKAIDLGAQSQQPGSPDIWQKFHGQSIVSFWV